MNRIIRIGARQSKLAMRQAAIVNEMLHQANPGCQVEIKGIKTRGDKLLDIALSKIGEKGLFIKELEQALLRDEIDVAVHSVKDLPTELAPGLCLGAVTKREDPRDVLISKQGLTLEELPAGAVVGTSSLRRRVQTLHLRPDLMVADLRGNVDTRLRKLENQEYDAIILAAAGLERLGWENMITQRLECDRFLPAVGQGALCLEIRSGNKEIEKMVAPLDHRPTRRCVNAERALLRALEGGCQIPLGAIAREEGNNLCLTAMVASTSGAQMVRESLAGPGDKPEALGVKMAERLKEKGAAEILRSIRQELEE